MHLISEFDHLASVTLRREVLVIRLRNDAEQKSAGRSKQRTVLVLCDHCDGIAVLDSELCAQCGGSGLLYATASADAITVAKKQP